MSGSWLLWSLLLLEPLSHSNRLLFGFGLPVEPLNHLHRGSDILCQEIDADLFKPESRIGVPQVIGQ